MKNMTLFWYFALALLITVMIMVVFRKRTSSQRRLFLILFSLCGIVYYLYNWVTVIYIPRDLLIILPLQLCDMAVFLMPVGLITGHLKVMDFLFYVCGLGALSAIILMGMASQDAFYEMNPNFFFSHYAILVIPILTIIWGLYDPKPGLKKALHLSAELMILAGLMHGLNLYLAHFLQANSYYFFTIIETGSQVSPLLALFAKIIPYDYFYLIPTLPIMVGYMGLVYLTRQQILKHPI